RAGADRPVEGDEGGPRRVRPGAYRAEGQGGTRRRAGTVRVVRRQLPAGPPAGGARRALRQPLPRLGGPTPPPRRPAAPELSDGRPAHRGVIDGPQAAEITGLDARNLAVGVRADAPG